MPIPENNVRFTDLSNGTVKAGSIFATSEPDSATPPNYDSTKVTAQAVGNFVATEQTYSGLSNKTIVQAINDAGGGSSSLAGLSDVNLTTPTDGQALVYDADSAKWVNGTGGGGNADFVELTQAEYDALEQAGLIEEDVMYFITDGQSSGEAEIDDSTTALNKVWSSSKVSSELDTKQNSLLGGSLSNVDLNDYRFVNANYWVSQTSVSNKPTTSFGYLEVIVCLNSGSSTIAIQRFTTYGSDSTTTRGDTYVRFYVNNQWYSWTQTASSRPEPVKAARSGLTIAASTTSYYTFSGIPVKSGYTRMVVCANPSEGGLYYLRTVENGDDLRIYINNSTGASVTFDLTIMVEYIAT